MLDYLEKEKIHEKLNSKGEYMRAVLTEIVEDEGLDYSVWDCFNVQGLLRG